MIQIYKDLRTEMGIVAWISTGYIKPIKKMAAAPRSQITNSTQGIPLWQ